MADARSNIPARDTIVPQTVGRFVIARVLGAGAMGTVYEAHDPELARRVALKIVSEPKDKDSLRLLREAQALAQLQHPNVVVIHDVGVMPTGVFIAMELVEGENLREHLARRSLSWRRVLSLYVQAGRGLAAAHEKSIVHRDFKPANVLIDHQGRVRVTDFGLARLAGGDNAAPPGKSPGASSDTTTADESHDAPAAAHAATGLLASPLTHEGALLGTPRYMAPEQRARRPASARSDQYSFCVCVWEAAFGVHPFPDGQDANTQPARAARTAPRWLARVLERGLSFDPALRFPSMTVLIDALERAPRNRRQVWAAVASIAVVAGGAALLVQGRSESDPCSDAPPLHAWTPEARVATRAAFVASGLPFARAVHDTVSERLDGYADRWRAMKVKTCRAMVARTQSDDLLARQNLCLDRRQDEVGALIAAMHRIPRAQVEKAVDALGNLADLRACEDVDALVRSAPLPQDATRATQVRMLEREIATVEAQQSIGRPEDRTARVEELFAKARELQYSPVVLRAFDLKLDVVSDSDRWPEFVELAHQQLVTAEAAGDDRARLRIYSMLVQGNARLRRHDEAANLGEVGEAMLQRFGDDPKLAARLYCSRCLAEWQAGDNNKALHYANLCVAERERDMPRDDAALADALQRRAGLHDLLNHYKEALSDGTLSVQLMERALGDRHPKLALALNTVGHVHDRLGRVDLAEQQYRRAIAILEETRGDSSPLSAALLNLANLLLDQHKYPDAIALYRRALSINERKLPAGDYRIANVLDMLGKALALSGDFEEGAAMGRRSIAIREANGNGDHPTQATAWRILGGTYRRAKQFKQSSYAYARSLRIMEGKHGTNHPMLVPSLLGIAEAEIEAGRPAAARPHLDRALPHLDAQEVHGERARLLYLVARTLWATPADRARAVEHAAAAMEHARAEKNDEYLPKIEAWRREHSLPRR